MGGQALGPCFAATCCGFPCELRQGSPPLVSETGHCMLCNAMPEAGRASMALEMCVMHCHAPPCPPASIAPQHGSTGTCTPLGSQLTIVRRAAAAKYRNKCACTSSVDPSHPQTQAFLLFCSPAALLPSPSPKQTRPSRSPRPKHLLLPPRKKKEKNPTELLGLQVLLDLPPPSLGLCENLNLSLTWPSQACAARLGRGSTAWNSFSRNDRLVCCDLSCRVPTRADEAYRVRNELRACVRCVACPPKNTHWGDLRTVQATRHCRLTPATLTCSSRTRFPHPTHLLLVQ